MKIILEGVNGCGKSMLSLALQEKYDLEIRHPGPRPTSNSAAINDCKEQLKLKSVILDRVTPISRLTYEDLDNMKTAHYNELMRYLSLMKKECIFIHCTGEGNHALKDYYTESHIKRITRDHNFIKNRYFELFKKIKHFEYDFNQNSLEEVYEYIEDCQRKR